MPARLFTVRDTFGSRRADFHQRILHFLDHQPDDLFGIFRFFQYGVDVGIDDVTESGKNTHISFSWNIYLQYC